MAASSPSRAGLPDKSGSAELVARNLEHFCSSLSKTGLPDFSPLFYFHSFNLVTLLERVKALSCAEGLHRRGSDELGLPLPLLHWFTKIYKKKSKMTFSVFEIFATCNGSSDIFSSFPNLKFCRRPLYCQTGLTHFHTSIKRDEL